MQPSHTISCSSSGSSKSHPRCCESQNSYEVPRICPEMILLEYDDWSYLGMKPVLTDDTLDHLIIDLLGK